MTWSLTIGTNYRLYRWQNWMDTLVTAFAGDPANGTAPPGERVGDTLAVTGSGTNTRLLAGVLGSGANNTTNVVLFSTSDGTNFVPTLIEIAGLPAVSGGPQFGLAFYTNNTFLYKPNGASIYLVQYPAVNPACPCEYLWSRQRRTPTNGWRVYARLVISRRMYLFMC